MKFQLKALAAAAILVAAIPAQANVALPATGNGSSILVMIDRTNNLTATFDLGLNYLNFNTVASAGAFGANNALTGAGLSIDLANNANYSTTWNAFTSNGGVVANSSFAFLAADGLGSGVGSQGLISTFVSAGATTTTNPLGTAIGALNTTLTNVNFVNLVGTSTFSAATTGAALQNTAISAPYNVTGKINNVGAVVFGAVGSTLGVNQYVTGASVVAAAQNSIFTGASMKLGTNGLFTYTTAAAPIPEADTSAMMLVGLGLMGFIARRRNRKQA